MLDGLELHERVGLVHPVDRDAHVPVRLLVRRQRELGLEPGRGAARCTRQTSANTSAVGRRWRGWRGPRQRAASVPASCQPASRQPADAVVGGRGRVTDRVSLVRLIWLPTGTSPSFISTNLLPCEIMRSGFLPAPSLDLRTVLPRAAGWRDDPLVFCRTSLACHRDEPRTSRPGTHVRRTRVRGGAPRNQLCTPPFLARMQTRTTIGNHPSCEHARVSPQDTLWCGGSQGVARRGPGRGGAD